MQCGLGIQYTMIDKYINWTVRLWPSKCETVGSLETGMQCNQCGWAKRRAVVSGGRADVRETSGSPSEEYKTRSEQEQEQDAQKSWK